MYIGALQMTMMMMIKDERLVSKM